MSEGTRHQRMCTLLLSLLRVACGTEHTAGSDQFLYFDASDPERCCAPDGYVKLNVPEPEEIRSWKTWERGTPELCIEILSRDAEEKLTLPEKLRRFHAMGIAEVVVFNADAEPGMRLRAWDLIEGDMVERVVDDESTPCLTLGLWFVVAPAPSDRLEAALRLARDPKGERLVLSPFEDVSTKLRQAAADAEQAQVRARDAEARAAELEAELARLRGK